MAWRARAVRGDARVQLRGAGQQQHVAANFETRLLWQVLDGGFAGENAVEVGGHDRVPVAGGLGDDLRRCAAAVSHYLAGVARRP